MTTRRKICYYPCGCKTVHQLIYDGIGGHNYWVCGNCGRETRVKPPRKRKTTDGALPAPEGR